MHTRSRQIVPGSDVLQAEAIIIDAENVRGKAAFTWSHGELVERIGHWASRCGLGGRVLIVYDHGDAPDALSACGGQVSVLFSGPGVTADDVIADAVRWLTHEARVVVTVFTADNELRQRCEKRACSRRQLYLVTSSSLVTTLRSLDPPEAVDGGGMSVADTSAPPSPGSRSLTLISGELRNVCKSLRAGVGAKKRTKLLRRKSQLLQRYWQVASETLSDNAATPPGRALVKYGGHPSGSPRRGIERTSDRLVLGEVLRRQLQEQALPTGLRGASAQYIAYCIGRSRTSAPLWKPVAGTTLAPSPQISAAAPGKITLTGLLLALDLGQKRGGWALFAGGDGRLLDYGCMAEDLVDPESALHRATRLARVLSGCEEDAMRMSAPAIQPTPLAGRLERVVLEGNRELRDTWRQRLADMAAVEDAGMEPNFVPDIVGVSADAWRRRLLIPKELRNQATAKAAARLVARQVLSTAGLAVPDKLDTNAAEAICVGHWACHDLWSCAGRRGGPRTAAVLRSLNGNIVRL